MVSGSPPISKLTESNDCDFKGTSTEGASRVQREQVKRSLCSRELSAKLLTDIVGPREDALQKDFLVIGIALW